MSRRAAALVVAAALGLSACGSDDGDDGSTTTEPSGEASSTTAAPDDGPGIEAGPVIPELADVEVFALSADAVLTEDGDGLAGYPFEEGAEPVDAAAALDLEPEEAATVELCGPMLLGQPGDGSATLRAVDVTTGEEAWSADLGGPEVSASPLCGGEVVVVFLTDDDGEGSVVALDTETGDERWDAPLSALDTARATDEVVVVSDDVLDGDKTLTAYALADGEELWSLTDDDVTPQVGGSFGVVVSFDGRAAVLDDRTGDELVEYPRELDVFEGEAWLVGTREEPVIVTDDDEVIGDDGEAQSFDGSTGLQVDEVVGAGPDGLLWVIVTREDGDGDAIALADVRSGEVVASADIDTDDGEASASTVALLEDGSVWWARG